MTFRTPTFAFAALLAVAAAPSAWAVGECRRFGTPSFTAERTVSIAGRTMRSKVFVRGTSEREEMEAGGHRSIRLVGPGRIVTWDPDAATGTIQAIPRPPPPPKDAMRIDVADEGGNKTVTITLRDKAGAWQRLARTTCRPDGVPLAQTFMAPLGGAPAEGSMTLSAVVVGPLAESLFVVPPAIRLGK